MISLTQKERETLLLLFKGIGSYYNANSMSKELGISHVGAQKILKRLSKDGLLISKRIGKSIVYKPKLDDDYVRKLFAFILADEAHNYKRWKEEFKGLSKGDRVIMLFGSAVRNYAKAGDIDIMIVMEEGELNDVKAVIKEKRKMLPKNIHSIELTADDLIGNINDGNKAIIDAIKGAIILYGQDKYVEAIKDVTRL